MNLADLLTPPTTVILHAGTTMLDGKRHSGFIHRQALDTQPVTLADGTPAYQATVTLVITLIPID